MTLVSSSAQKNILQKLPGKIIADDKNFVTLQLTVDDWINVPGHPRQRDILRHSKALHWQAAQEATGALKIHLGHVVGGILNNTLYKIDGHTRAHLWETGQLEYPQHIIVTAYRVKDKKELNDLYGVMDIASAAERPSDQISGAYQESGLILTSKRLKNGNIGEALYMAARGEPKAKRSKKKQSFDLYEAVKIFAPELQVVDQLNPDPKVFCSGILAAALIMQTLKPETLEFFRLLGEKRGEKSDGRMDPVESVLDVINDLRYSKQLYYGVGQLELCARCIRAVYNWLEGSESTRYWLKNKVYAYNLKPLIEVLREKKGITDNPRL
jgi:hypothetical protein